jgi:hypothetical protein
MKVLPFKEHELFNQRKRLYFLRWHEDEIGFIFHLLTYVLNVIKFLRV